MADHRQSSLATCPVMPCITCALKRDAVDGLSLIFILRRHRNPRRNCHHWPALRSSKALTRVATSAPFALSMPSTLPKVSPCVRRHRGLTCQRFDAAHAVRRRTPDVKAKYVVQAQHGCRRNSSNE
jgi:hypothetical protein